MKAVSIISIVYGVFGLLWATVVSIVIRVQAVLFENIPWPPDVEEIMDVPALLETVHSIIGTLFPFVFLIAILFIISGILQLAGKSSYKNLGYAAAILNIIWYIVYIILMQVEFVPVMNSMELFPGNLLNILIIFGMLFNAIFYCGYPIFLIIYYYRGGRSWDTLDTNYTS